MKRLLWFLVFALPCTLMAQGCPRGFPCEAVWGLWCGNLEGFAELLYMRPSRCNLNFVITDPRAYIEPEIGLQPQVTTEQVGPEGTLCGVRPHYHTGFRVGAAYVTHSQCFDLTGRYTRIHTRDTARATPDPTSGGLWAILLNSSDPTAALENLGAPPYVQVILFNRTGEAALPGEIDAVATGSTEFNLDTGDLTLGARNVFCCKLWLRGFLGVHYANLYHQFDVHYEGTLHPGERNDQLLGAFESQALRADVQMTSRAWGVGPQVGGALIYEIGCGFGVSGRFGLGLLGGSQRATYFQDFRTETTTDDPTELVNRTTDISGCSDTNVARYLNARLGANYSFCCPCTFVVIVDFGYEFVQYDSMLPTGPSFRMDRGINDVPCLNYNMDGFYLHITVGF